MAKLRIADASLPKQLRQVVDYRKSGLSLNHVVGCPLDCGYCVRHLFDNFQMKKPQLVMPDSEAVELLLSHWAFRSDITPIQIFNRATDPFLPIVKDHLFNCLEDMDRQNLKNHVLVITRWHIQQSDVDRLNKLRNIKLTILVTWSGIEDTRIEPVNSAIAESSIRTLAKSAINFRFILYWRPIIAGINDTQDHIRKAAELSDLAQATVFTGLFYREEIREYFSSIGVKDIYDEIARRKIMPKQIEQKIVSSLNKYNIFRKTSCAIGYVHQLPDYNGHYGIREICDICPAQQQSICANAHCVPTMDSVTKLAAEAGLDADTVRMSERNIEVAQSYEQQRYFMQHNLNFQVHDRAQPHHYGRHGRADLGWT